MNLQVQFIHSNTDQEIDNIAELAKVIWRDHYIPIVGEEQVTYMLEKFQSVEAMTKQIEEGYAYYSILFNKELIGYFAFIAEGQNLFLSKFYLHKEYRGRGFAKQSLHFITEQAKKHQKTAIRLTVNKFNTNAIKAYLKMGFKNNGPTVAEIGNGFIMDDYEMLLVL